MQTVYDQYFITLYNIVYTSLPVLAMGVFDQVWWGAVEGGPWLCKDLALLPCGEEGLPGCLGWALLVPPAVVEAGPALAASVWGWRDLPRVPRAPRTYRSSGAWSTPSCTSPGS